MFKSILLIACLIITGNATAQEVIDPLDKIYLDVHLISLHTQTEFDVDGEHYSLNQVNYGLGITFPAYEHTGDRKAIPYASYRFGFYKNSYSDMSFYGGIDFHTAYTNGFGAGVILGVVNGYANSPNGVDQGGVIVPHVHYIHNRFKTEVGFLRSKYSPALTLTVSYSF